MHGHVSRPLEALGNCVQSGIMATLRFNFGNRGQNVIPVCPGSAMSLPYQMDLAVKIEASGVLDVTAIGDIDQGRHVL